MFFERKDFVLCLDTQICFSRHGGLGVGVKNKMLLIVLNKEEKNVY